MQKLACCHLNNAVTACKKAGGAKKSKEKDGTLTLVEMTKSLRFQPNFLMASPITFSLSPGT